MCNRYVRGRSWKRVISYSMGLFPGSIHQLKARFRCHWARECHGIAQQNTSSQPCLITTRLGSDPIQWVTGPFEADSMPCKVPEKSRFAGRYGVNTQERDEGPLHFDCIKCIKQPSEQAIEKKAKANSREKAFLRSLFHLIDRMSQPETNAFLLPSPRVVKSI